MKILEPSDLTSSCEQLEGGWEKKKKGSGERKISFSEVVIHYPLALRNARRLFLSICYSLLGRKRLIAWDLNCHFVYNTLTDQCKNKPTRNYILKMYKDTKSTNRECSDSILDSVINDRKEGASGIVPLVFALIVCTWCYWFVVLSVKGVGFS